jgi:hypothetical protein
MGFVSILFLSGAGDSDAVVVFTLLILVMRRYAVLLLD